MGPLRDNAQAAEGGVAEGPPRERCGATVLVDSGEFLHTGKAN